MNKEQVNELQNWIKESFRKRTLDNFCSDKFKKHVESKYGLKLLAEDGISRVVYKKPYSREVVKFTYFVHNIAENCVYQAYKNTPIGDILAECINISDTGTILVQRYMPHHLPGCDSFSYYYDGIYISVDFMDMRQALGDIFCSEGQILEDFHENNIRFDSKGKVKIIDYAGIGEQLTTRYYVTQTKSHADKVRQEINKKLKNKNHTKSNIEFTYDGELKLSIGNDKYSLNISKPKFYMQDEL